MNVHLYPLLPKLVMEMVFSNKWKSISIEDDHMGGKGVFATKPILHGAYVCHYGGDFLDGNAGNEVILYGSTKFLLEVTINRKSYYFNHCDPEKLTFGAMMNHSKRHPNCIKKLHQSKKGKPVVVLKALRNIDAGEELLHDYGTKYEELPPCSVNCRLCDGRSCDE